MPGNTHEEKKSVENPNSFFNKIDEDSLVKQSRRYLSVWKNKDAADDNIDCAKKLIVQGVNVNFILPFNSNGLSKFDKNKTNYNGLIGETALMNYALSGAVEMVKYILENGGDKTINVRNFDLLNLGPYVCIKQESDFLGIKNEETHRYESALSMALLSNSKNSFEIFKILLKNNADLSIFDDNDDYKPVVLSGIYDLKGDVAYVEPKYRNKVELLVQTMKEQNIHLNSCKNIYQVLSNMLSQKGHKIHLDQDASCGFCVIN